MDTLRAGVALAMVLRAYGVEVRRQELEMQANEEAQRPGMTWADYRRENLQPESTFCLTASAIASGALLAGLGGFAGGLCATGYCDWGKVAAAGMVPLGAVFFCFCAARMGAIETNRRNAELIRRLDAGEYIPRPPDDH